MKTNSTFRYLLPGLLICLGTLLMPFSLEAQRKGGSRQAGGKEKSGTAKPASGNKATARPAEGNKENTRTSTGNKNNSSTGNKTNVSTGNKTNVSTGNKTNVSTGNKTNVNVNNSKNVNVNVNNSRSTVVIANPRPYPRPPYAYGGHSYYAYHPYHYHPYTPYHYGPPVGFFIATMAATAIIVTVASQQYHYDQGVYYVSSNGGYTAVPAPVGATITTLPPGSQTVVINETTNNYYYGGTYYEKKPEGYTVVPPTAGAVVEKLPEGGKEEKIGEVTYVKVGETYYQPITQDGKSMYEVVDVKTDQ
jgi:hypothetical protein